MNVALVRTPLNVICVREALSLFGLDPADTWLGVYDHPRPAARRQLWSSLEDTGLLDDVASVNLLPPITPVVNMARMAKLGRQLHGQVTDVILGSYVLGPFRYLVDLVDPQRIIVVDDGAATVQVAKRRLAWSQDGRKGSHVRWSGDTTLESPVDRERARLGRFLARLRLHPGYYADIAREPDELTIFTYLELPDSLPDDVVRHSFPTLAEKLDAAPRSDTTMFLGSPLVRTGKIDRSDYLDYLERAHRTVGHFIYIAHRQERPEDRRAIEDRLGVAVDQPSRCIELAIGREFPVPARVVAPWSSALESLAVLLGDRTSVGHLPIPLELFRAPARTRAARRYAYLAQLKHIPVEPLELS